MVQNLLKTQEMLTLYVAFKTALVSGLVTLFLLPELVTVASRIGLVDAPARRKVHTSPKPLVGGVGIMLGIAVAVMLFLPMYQLSQLRGVLAGLFLLTLIGFLDDYINIGHKVKFVVQVIAAFMMIRYSKTSLVTFGDLLSFGSVDFESLSIPVTIFCTVGVINAFNMIDGLDGLAGGISITAFTSFGVLAFMNGHTSELYLSAAFLGATLAFLRHNYHPSKLFMGDAGSLAIGFVLAFMAISLTQDKDRTVPPVAPLIILAVPIVDTVTVMTRRMMKGFSPFKADKGHLHHLLLRFGMEKKTAANVVVLMTASFALFGVLGTTLSVPEYVMFSVFMLYFILYFVSSFYIKQGIRFFRRRKRRSTGISKSGKDDIARRDSTPVRHA